jgi:hypothetical protein
MSVSCIGTCSNCGVRRFWLSDTLSLQLDNGRLTILRHPAEGFDCEQQGLTLAQASDLGRLFRETFYVCRNCGADGETIAKEMRTEWQMVSVRGTMKWAWGSAVVVVPLLAWMRWWQAAWIIGGTLAASPAIEWRENRKVANALAARGLPRVDAPGAFRIPEPAAGSLEEMIVGRLTTDPSGRVTATAPCCDKPEWIEAYRVKDEDCVPCRACGRGVMVVSDHAIH